MLTAQELKEKIIVFTDGACSGNPGPGGWAAIIAFPEGKVKELGGQGEHTTNNKMEILGVLQALKFLKNETRTIVLYTDSTYVIRGATQWIWGWKKNKWNNASGEPVSNRELWEELDLMLSKRGRATVEWKYCRGHQGTPGNERCDEIAVGMSQKKWVDLFEGSLLNYSVAIHDLPEDEELPEMKPKEVKAPAYSYLSFLGGKVLRHRTWASCEARVKGQSGAKFKKAMSAQDEPEILKSWGLSAAHPIEDV